MAKCFEALAARASALQIFFSSSSSSTKSWCLYSTTVFHPYGDLSARSINFCLSLSKDAARSRDSLTFKPLDQHVNSHLLPLFISYASSEENSIKYQENSSCVIMSVILMPTLFYKAVILHREIWCWSLLGLKGLTFGRSFRSTAAEAFSRASKTNLLVVYFSSLLLYICCSNSESGESNISGTNETHRSTRTTRGRAVFDVNT